MSGQQKKTATTTSTAQGTAESPATSPTWHKERDQAWAHTSKHDEVDTPWLGSAGLETDGVSLKGAHRQQYEDGTSDSVGGGVKYGQNGLALTTEVAATNAAGRETKGGMSVDTKGVGFNGEMSQGNHKGTAALRIEDNKVDGSLGYQNMNPKTGNGFGGSLGGGVTLDHATAGKVEDGGTGLAANAVNIASSQEIAADQGNVPLHMLNYESGKRFNASVNASVGAFGAKANYAYESKAQTSFFSRNEDPKAEKLKKQPKAYQRYMERTHGDKTENKDGDRASGLKDLQYDKLNPGEGLAVQTSSSHSGGGGISVSGIGVAVNGGKGQSQRTTAYRETDGRLTFDIQTGTTGTLGADVEALNGVAAIGGSKSEGKTSRVRFSFTADEAGEKALEMFNKTGVLPGATEGLEADDPILQRFNTLSESKDLTKDQQAEMAVMAEKLNRDLMARDLGDSLPSAPGVQYQQMEKGSDVTKELHAKLAGFTLGDMGSSVNRREMIFHENGRDQKNIEQSERTDNFWSADTVEGFEINKPGSHILSLSVLGDADGSDEGIKDTYRAAGEKTPAEKYLIFEDWDWFVGNQDQLTMDMNEGQRKTFTEGMDQDIFKEIAARNEEKALDNQSELEYRKLLLTLDVLPQDKLAAAETAGKTQALDYAVANMMEGMDYRANFATGKDDPSLSTEDRVKMGMFRRSRPSQADVEAEIVKRYPDHPIAKRQQMWARPDLSNMQSCLGGGNQDHRQFDKFPPLSEGFGSPMRMQDLLKDPSGGQAQPFGQPKVSDSDMKALSDYIASLSSPALADADAKPVAADPVKSPTKPDEAVDAAPQEENDADRVTRIAYVRAQQLQAYENAKGADADTQAYLTENPDLQWFQGLNPQQQAAAVKKESGADRIRLNLARTDEKQMFADIENQVARMQGTQGPDATFKLMRELMSQGNESRKMKRLVDQVFHAKRIDN